jgi:UDP-glucose 4-epimerase
MNILILGSKGFIGSHCSNYFKVKGDTVVGADILKDNTASDYFLLDALHPDYKELFSGLIFDICVNCSGAASVSMSIEEPGLDFELNTLNVFRMLDAIRLFNPDCKFIQLSSAAVYGNPAMLPVKEEHALNPVSPYGWHKYYSEQICNEFSTIYNSRIAILRPFSVFGKGLRKQLFWDVFHKINSGKPFELFGTGEETRDFLHVTDLVLIIDLIIRQGDFNGEVYNAANGEAIRIKDVIHDFVELTGTSVSYSFNKKVKAGDPLYWQADIAKISRLGYVRKMSTAHGLKEYVQWLKENG